MFSNVPISSSGEAKAGQGLAAQLRIVNDEVVAFVQGCSPQQWQGSSRDEGWLVAVVAQHRLQPRDDHDLGAPACGGPADARDT